VSERQAPHFAIVFAYQTDRLASPRIPKFHGPILDSQGQPAAVRAEAEGKDLPGLAEGEGVLESLRVPNLNDPRFRFNTVVARRGQAPAIGAERQTKDDHLHFRESPSDVTGLHVPDVHRRVEPRRGDAPAIRADRQAPHFVSVAPEGQQFVALFARDRRRVPQPDGPILTRRGKKPAIRAERQALAPISMAAEVEDLLSR
jgi:hypothetical protein